MPYKTARAAELFWLVASIATTLYVLCLWWTEDLTRWTVGLFPCIATRVSFAHDETRLTL